MEPPHAQFEQGLDCIRKGLPGKALPLLEEAFAARPDDPRVLYSLGVARLRGGHVRDGLNAFDRLLECNPAHPGALHGRGLCLNAWGDRTGALDAFRQAVIADPLAWRTWRSIADITPFEDDRVHALEGAADALQVLSLDSSPSPARMVETATALLDARRAGRASAYLRLHGAGTSSFAALTHTLARSLYRDGDFAGAFQQALRLMARPHARDNAAPPATGLEPGLALASLSTIQSVLAKHGIDSFLAAGTLLGFHRNGGPLPHDRDLDIGILQDRNGGPDLAGILRQHEGILLPRNSRPGDRYFALMHEGVAVDLFLYKQGEHGLSCGFSSLPGDINWRFTGFTLKKATYGGRDWTVPSNPARYLSETYGPSWQVTDKGFASAVSSPALHGVDIHARAYHAVIRACQAAANGQTWEARALLAQSPTPATPPPHWREH